MGMQRMRAQAAAEFLMTYGWAVLIMLVVIAVLFYSGAFGAQGAPKSCTLPSGFTCADFDIDTGGNLHLFLGQATGKTVTVTGIGCSANASPAVSGFGSPVSIPTGASALVTGAGVPCFGASYPAFRGKVAIQYTTAGSGLARTVTGELSAPMDGALSGAGMSYPYGDSAVLALNLDNNYAIGESSTLAVDSSGYGNNCVLNGSLFGTGLPSGTASANAGSSDTQLNESNELLYVTSANGYFNGWYLWSGGLMRTITASVGTGSSGSRVWLLTFNESITGFTTASAYRMWANEPRGPQWTSDGHSGSALAFDGLDDIGNCGNAQNIRVKKNFTWEAWFKPGELGREQRIIQRGHDMNQLTQTSGNKIFCTLSNDSWGTIGSVTSAASVSVGSWYHVACVYDSDAVKLYVNGQLAGQNAGAGFGTDAGRSGGGYYIILGKDTYTSSRVLNGSIDGVRIYNRSLTADEVLAHFNGG